MHRTAPLFALALACLCPAANAATFTMHQITVQGSTSVDATALNDHGDFVGTVVLGGVNQIGFEQSGSTFTALQGPCGVGTCQAYPTAINNAGTITGLAFGAEAGGFIWQNGGFVAGDFFSTGNSSSLTGGPWLNNRGEIAYNVVSSMGEQIFAGLPGHTQLQSGIGLAANSSILTGLNDAGVLTGITLITNRGAAAFAGRRGIFADLPVSVASGTPSVVINDHNVLAGSTGTGIWIYANNTQTTVPGPAQSANLTVAGINSAGRIVGAFTDQGAGVQRAFLYSHGVLSSFGSYPEGDTVHVAINHAGRMLISDVQAHSFTGTSYLALCRGTGC